MNKQVNVQVNGQTKRQTKRHWRKLVAAAVLAAALTALPALAVNGSGPLSNLLAQPAYACPLGGNCG